MTDSSHAVNGARLRQRRRAPGWLLTSFWIRFLLTILGAALVAGAIQGFRPLPLDHLRREVVEAGGRTDRDLLQEMRSSLETLGSPVVIRQGELNRYLSATLRGRLPQPAAAALFESIPVVVFAELSTDTCDLHLEMTVGTWRTTFTLRCQVIPQNGSHLVRMHHGRAGHLPLYGGLLAPALPAFRSLADSLAPELEAVLRMQRIEIRDSEIVLHPKPFAGP